MGSTIRGKRVKIEAWGGFAFAPNRSKADVLRDTVRYR